MGTENDDFATVLRLLRTWERVNGVLLALASTQRAIDHLRDAAGSDLDPEILEACTRLDELVDHLAAASRVLDVKIKLAVGVE